MFPARAKDMGALTWSDFKSDRSEYKHFQCGNYSFPYSVSFMERPASLFPLK